MEVFKKKSQKIQDSQLRNAIEEVERSRISRITTSRETLPDTANLARAIDSLPTTLKQLEVRNRNDADEVLKTVSKETNCRQIQFLNLPGSEPLDLEVEEKSRDRFGMPELDWSLTELTCDSIQQLGDMHQLKRLWLNHSTFKHDSIAQALAKLINKGLEALLLADSGINDSYLEEINKELDEQILLKSLDLSHISLKESGVKAVAGIVGKSGKFGRLALSDCDISDRHLAVFTESVGCKIRELDLSSNHELFDGKLELLSKLADKVGCEVLDISSNWLDSDKIAQLTKTSRPKQIAEVRLSDNPIIDAAPVGTLVKVWQLSRLDVSECRLGPKGLKTLAESVEYKMDRVDVRDPIAVKTKDRKDALEFLATKTRNLIDM